MQPTRLSHLLDRYVDEALTREECAELERMLLASPRARQEFWQQTRLHAMIRQCGEEEWGRTLSEAAGATLSCAHDTSDALSDHRASSRRRSFWKAGLAAAACVAALGLWLLQTRLAPSERGNTPSLESEIRPGVGVLTRMAGVVWSDRQVPLMSGTVLSLGWIRLAAGAVQIEFFSGVQVILEGPAELELVSARACRLRQGRMNAHVAESGRGFKVLSSRLEVVDRGTAFGLSVAANGAEEVHVFQGLVEVTRVNEATAARNIRQGLGILADESGLREFPAAPDMFLSEDKLAERERLEQQRHLDAWRQTSRDLDRDPATLVHFTFEGQSTLDRVLTNQSSIAGVGTHGSIIGCAWTSGRWPGKGALEFSGDGDRVRFAIPGRFESLTFLAWLRVDGLLQSYNAIALTDHQDEGAVHWILKREGELRFGVSQGWDGPKIEWDTAAAPGIAPEHTGRWLCLAAVADGNRLLSYVNGQLVASAWLRRPKPLVLGFMELGNWGATPKTRPGPEAGIDMGWYYRRGFQGRIDEFAVLARALSAQEIRRLFDLGRPSEVRTALAKVKPY